MELELGVVALNQRPKREHTRKRILLAHILSLRRVFS